MAIFIISNNGDNDSSDDQSLYGNCSNNCDSDM